MSFIAQLCISGRLKRNNNHSRAFKRPAHPVWLDEVKKSDGCGWNMFYLYIVNTCIFFCNAVWIRLSVSTYALTIICVQRQTQSLTRICRTWIRNRLWNEMMFLVHDSEVEIRPIPPLMRITNVIVVVRLLENWYCCDLSELFRSELRRCLWREVECSKAMIFAVAHICNASKYFDTIHDCIQINADHTRPILQTQHLLSDIWRIKIICNVVHSKIWARYRGITDCIQKRKCNLEDPNLFGFDYVQFVRWNIQLHWYLCTKMPSCMS